MDKNTICCVVVFYNPSLKNIERIRILSHDINVIAVDNSLGDNNIGGDACYIPLFENKGIAVAQNLGLKKAKELGYKFIVFIDQDSTIDKNYIESIHSEYNRIKEEDPSIGILGPLVIDESRNIEYKTHTDPNKEYEIVSHIISSGSIIEMDTIDKIGLLEEDLFIDLVDSEWCWRAKRYGYNTYMTRNVILYHSIGKDYKKMGPVAFTISSPNRYYYQYRNTLWMMSRKYVPLNWKIRTILRRIMDMFVVPFMSENGFHTLSFMMGGWRDGLKGDKHES